MNFPVELKPELLLKAEKLGVRAGDVTEQFVRGSGKGGQKVNKSSSCVLLRHIPTGVEVRCQRFRELFANREEAYKLLILKIEQKVMGRESERAREIFRLRKQKKKRSKRAKEKMVDEKRRRAVVKEGRRGSEF